MLDTKFTRSGGQNLLIPSGIPASSGGVCHTNVLLRDAMTAFWGNRYESNAIANECDMHEYNWYAK